MPIKKSKLWIAYFIAIFSCVPMILIGQNIEVVTSVYQEASAQIDLVKGVVSNVSSEDKIKIDLQDDELVVSYKLPDLIEELRFYEVIPVFQLDGQKVYLIPHDEYRGDWGMDLSSGKKELRWINLQNNYLQLKGELKVVLQVNYWGERNLPYDCSLGIPEFTKKEKLPYIIGAGLGALSIGAGQIFRSQSQDIYTNDYLTSSSFAEASPIYEDANKKHQTYLLLTYIGAGILVSDITLFVIKSRKIRKQRKLYDEYCGGDYIGMPSKINISTGFVSGGPGLKLKMNF